METEADAEISAAKIGAPPVLPWGTRVPSRQEPNQLGPEEDTIPATEEELRANMGTRAEEDDLFGGTPVETVEELSEVQSMDLYNECTELRDPYMIDLSTSISDIGEIMSNESWWQIVLFIYIYVYCVYTYIYVCLFFEDKATELSCTRILSHLPPKGHPFHLKKMM